jgi:hypothetical protein
MKKRPRIAVPHFRAALEARPELLQPYPKNTASRYRNGELPRFARWLVENPELLCALRKDAETLQQAVVDTAA